jgi:outer membrane protein OmpA-like peptidoglycan-associated protein
MPLSEKRAVAVQTYLVKKGLTAARVEAKGYGATQPTAANDTEAGKKQNRRVEIVLGQ